jgi:hypothetical protein
MSYISDLDLNNLPKTEKRSIKTLKYLKEKEEDDLDFIEGSLELQAARPLFFGPSRAWAWDR